MWSWDQRGDKSAFSRGRFGGIKGQQGIALEARTPAAISLDGEAHDKNCRQAGANENGDGENLHTESPAVL
jgi:hypothetical protein